MLILFLRTLRDDTSGGTAIEYGLVCALIVIAMLVSLQAVADRTMAYWDRVEEEAVEAMTQ